MLLACDFAYAVAGARFMTEVTLGLMPGAGGTQTLPRTAGERRAKEIILTGKPFEAREARSEWGVVNALYEPDADAGSARDHDAHHPTTPIAVTEARRAIHVGRQKDLAAAMRFEIEGCTTSVVRPRTAAKASAPSTRSANPNSKATDMAGATLASARIIPTSAPGCGEDERLSQRLLARPRRSRNTPTPSSKR